MLLAMACAVVLSVTDDGDQSGLPFAGGHSQGERLLRSEVQTAFPSAEPDGVLGWPELARLALSGNPSLRQAEARWGESRGRAIQAGLYPNPRFVPWDPTNLGDGGTVGQFEVFVQQSIITGGKLTLERRRAELEALQASWRVEARRRRVLNELRLAYDRILSRRREQELHRELDALYTDLTDRVSRSIDGDNASRADLLTARVESRRRRLALAESLDRCDEAWRALALLIGRPEMPPANLVDDLERESLPLDWPSSRRRLFRDSPEVRIAELAVDRERLGLRRAMVEPVPDFYVRLGVSPDPISNQVFGSFRFNMELPIWDRNQGNIVAAGHRVADSRLDLTRLSSRLEARLATEARRLATRLAAAREYRDAIIPEAREAFLLYRGRFDRGESSASRVLSALSTYAEVRSAYLDSLIELHESEVAVHGLLLDDEPGLPEDPPILHPRFPDPLVD